MNNKEAIRRIENILDPFPCAPPFSVETCEALEMAIDALKAQLSQEGTTSDTISRQAAIELCREKLIDMKADPDFYDDAISHYAGSRYNDGVNTCIDVIEELPLAQPEFATITIGRTKGGVTMWYECDACGEPVDENDNYCRNCGRRLIHG